MTAMNDKITQVMTNMYFFFGVMAFSTVAGILLSACAVLCIMRCYRRNQEKRLATSRKASTFMFAQENNQAVDDSNNAAERQR